MANQKRNRLLALALALCLALGMLLPAGQVNAEGRSAGILTEVTGQEREQLASLLYIAVSKTVLSMENIDILFKMQREHYSAGEAYDTFCNELEACLPVVFGYQKAAPLPTDVNDERMLLRSTILAAANKMYLDCCFEALRQEENLWADILPDLM